MSNTDNIRKMYSKITAPEDAVKRCLEIENSQRKKICHFPVKKVVAIAACIGILLAVAIPVGANKIYNAFEGVEEYGSQFPQKTEFSLTEIGESSIMVTEGSKISAKAQGLEIKAESAFYDGAYLYLSFAGAYDGDTEGIDRFFCSGADNYIKINGEFVKADITGYSFSLFNIDGGFAGTLGFIYPSNSENLEVEINIPYLQILGGEQGRDRENEVLGEIDESIALSFFVKKNASATFVRNENAKENDLDILSVTASKVGVAVEMFVPEEFGANTVTVVTDEAGNNAYFILGKTEEIEGGYNVKRYFEPVNGKMLDIAVYDKNNMDAGALATFENISIG